MTRAKAARTFIGIACLAIITLSLGWFVGHFVPGTPKALADKPTQRSSPGETVFVGDNIDPRFEIFDDTPFGKTAHLEERTLGKKFNISQETIDSWTEDEREHRLNSEHWEYRASAIDATIMSARLITPDAFAQWYPHWAETTGGIEAKNQDALVMLVEAQITNVGEKPTSFAVFSLMDFSKNEGDLNQMRQFTCNKYLLEEFYGEPSNRGLVEYHLPDDWSTLEPGESRLVTLPYLIPSSLPSNPNNYDQPDLSQFCLATPSFDPPTLYRIWLG